MSRSLPGLKRILNAKGQSLVEFALILPVLLLLILGVIEFGRAFYMKNTLVNAVRNAARKAVVNSNWNQNTIRFWTYSAVPASWRNSTVITSVLANPSLPPASGSGASINITAQLKFNTIVPNFYCPFKNTTISAHAMMRYEQ